MNVVVLRSQEYSVSRWKNGLGSTRTVAISPLGSGLDNFDWRVSMADVGALTPFSALPGVDRWLMPADGQALVVDVDGKQHVLDIGDALPFSGNASTSGGVDPSSSATEANGSRDLNLMVRRPHDGASLQSVAIAAGEQVHVDLFSLKDCSVRVVIVLSGELQVGQATLRKFDAVVVSEDPQFAVSEGLDSDERDERDEREQVDVPLAPSSCQATVDTMLAVATIG